MSKSTTILIAFMALCTLTPANGQDGKIMTWSAWVNSTDWNQSLGVAACRRGCSNTPAMCVQSSCKTAREHYIQVFLAIAFDSRAVKYATEYSRLRLTCPALIEVGFDDLIDQYHTFAKSHRDPEESLVEIIGHLKSANSRLKFGGAFYEDQLSRPGLWNTELPPPIRERFDYVHLFLHFREDGPNYANYVRKAKRLFPHARIIAGSYASAISK